MKRVLFFLILFTCLVESARADEWDFTDKTLAATAVALTVIDWRQSQEIVKHPERWRENNPVLGEHPSMRRLNMVAVGSIITMLVVAEVLPKEYRKYWLSGCIVYEYSFVQHNHNIGIRFGF